MCGIVGTLGHFENRELCINNMLQSLVHRGPDDQGLYFDKKFAGGMRRLSINDLKGGSQPLYNSDKSIILFYNGEIYNFLLLKKELEKNGVVFRTQSDGEVIPHLYEKFGVKVFEKLDGMFAAAIWDVKHQRLILGRDLPGEKPLYYSNLGGGRLVFGSEVKALRKIHGLNLTMNHQALWDFPSFLWIPEPATAFNEIKALPRGNYLIAENNEIIINSYENLFTPTEINKKNDIEIIKIVRDEVEAAVKSRLLSDVPVGSFLSGGLDSSIVASIAARELPSIDTFTISFENIDDPYHGKADESIAASETAKIIGSNHHNIQVTATSFRDSLDDFCHYGDLPFGVSSGLGIIAIASAAREANIKVLLTGDGADECFGGYSWYSYLDNIKNNNQVLLDKPISFQNYGLTIKERLKIMGSMPPAQRAWAWHYYAHEKEKKSLFSEEWQEGLKSSLRHFQTIKNTDVPYEYIKHDRAFYFPNEMLRKVDRMAMMHSVEGRTPFAAPQIMALANKLSYTHLVRNGTLKWILRKAFEDFLPMEIINRPKHGFNVPIDHWLKGEWSDLVDETFEKGSALYNQGIISSSSLGVAKNLLKDKNRLNGHSIFCFIMLNKWLSN